MQLKSLKKAFFESLKAVVPIMTLVILLSAVLIPMPAGTMLAFLSGGLMLIVGMMLFSLGAELSMETMGSALGTHLTKTKKIWFILLFALILGIVITIAEPDLQVLAEQVSSIDKTVLILAIAIGVGVFLVLALVRMIIGFPISWLLVGSYAVVIILSFFVPKNFLAVSFDSGGVTTGPMTVPFIMAFGVGITAIRSDRHAADDSFGLVALCSVGPILAVMILGILFKPDEISNTLAGVIEAENTVELSRTFIQSFPIYVRELLISLLPILVIFGAFQIFALRLKKSALIRIGVGILYTYVGLVLFMTGVNIGFLPVGIYMGRELASLPVNQILIPIGMLIGFFIVNAEPAIYVLMRQVEEITDGAIKGKVLKNTLCISVSISIGLALFRIFTGIPISYFVIPGYVIALLMSFFSPKIFTAIAFDSGGVASGPMTTTFLLPMALGACSAVGGNLITDAFGVVAMVAMTPLIAIQALGIIYKYKGEKLTEANHRISEEDFYQVIEL